MAVTIRSLRDTDATAWDAFVLAHPDGTFFHRAYEVSKDGQQFLIATPAQAGGAAITVFGLLSRTPAEA